MVFRSRYPRLRMANVRLWQPPFFSLIKRTIHQDDCAAYRDQRAVNKSAGRVQAEMARDKAANERAGDAQQNVHEEPVARALHDLAREPARNQAKPESSKIIPILPSLIVVPLVAQIVGRGGASFERSLESWPSQRGIYNIVLDG